MLDAPDSKAVAELMTAGRMSWADLAARLGMSPQAAAERVRKLEERGVIRGFAAIADPEAIGLGLLAFVAVALDRPEHRDGFLAWARDCPHVQECHHLAGDDDYLVKLRCRGTGELERLISDELKGLPGVARTRTSIALSTVKETATLPLAPAVSRSGDA
jgi:Lrp/AsnC family leucine-responsive transcriptional regulator